MMQNDESNTADKLFWLKRRFPTHYPITNRKMLQSYGIKSERPETEKKIIKTKSIICSQNRRP